MYCSSEDPNFPGTELNKHDVKGWQSAKFCEYPQEIGLQLEGGDPQIAYIQYLSHQTKIASKVEIFLGQGSRYETASFRRLGYLSLDTNERTDYKARELKTVYVDRSANFVRLILHKNHMNPFNNFNQVGVIAVNFMGPETPSSSSSSSSVPVVASPKYSSQPRSNPSNGPGSLNDLAFDMNLDPQTASKIRQLAEAKTRAVQQEDYALAKQIKAVEGDLKQLGAQLAQLDIAKRQAVQAEDYDRAKDLKDEGDSLRSEIERKVSCFDLMSLIVFYSGYYLYIYIYYVYRQTSIAFIVDSLPLFFHSFIHSFHPLFILSSLF